MPILVLVAAFDDGLILLGMEQNRAATRAAGVIAEERKPPKGTEQETGARLEPVGMESASPEKWNCCRGTRSGEPGRFGRWSQ